MTKLQTFYQKYYVFANKKTLISSEIFDLDYNTELFLQKTLKKTIIDELKKVPEIKQKSLAENVEFFWWKFVFSILEIPTNYRIYIQT